MHDFFETRPLGTNAAPKSRHNQLAVEISLLRNRSNVSNDVGDALVVDLKLFEPSGRLVIGPVADQILDLVVRQCDRRAAGPSQARAAPGPVGTVALSAIELERAFALND